MTCCENCQYLIRIEQWFRWKQWSPSFYFEAFQNSASFYILVLLRVNLKKMLYCWKKAYVDFLESRKRICIKLGFFLSVREISPQMTVSATFASHSTTFLLFHLSLIYHFHYHFMFDCLTANCEFPWQTTAGHLLRIDFPQSRQKPNRGHFKQKISRRKYIMQFKYHKIWFFEAKRQILQIPIKPSRIFGLAKLYSN